MGNRFGVCLVPFIVLSSPVYAVLGDDLNQKELGLRTEFTFVPGQWPLLVPVQFGSRACDFVLDTGCTGTMFDRSFRPQLGKVMGKRRVSGLGNSMTVQVFAAPRAFMGPFNLADCNQVVSADLKGLAEIVGREVPGVIGMDTLSKHILRIDFDKGRIAFLDDEQADRPDWGEELPITYNSMRMPQIRLAMSGWAAEDFVVDTGCETTGAFARDSFRRIVAQDHLKPADTAMAAMVGVVNSGQVRVDRVAVGPFEYRGLIFSEAKANVLGTGFLSRHIVTFDFPHGRIYLKKGKGFDKPDEAGMCGVSLSRYEGRTVVSAVYKGQPAARAGIRVGDVILAIQGRDVATYGRWEIRDLLRSGHGKEITMIIQRGGRTMKVVVILERQI